MNKKTFSFWFAAILIIALLTACGGNATTTTAIDSPVDTSQPVSSDTTSDGATSDGATSDGATTDTNSADDTTTSPPVVSVAEAAADNQEPNIVTDAQWDDSAGTLITLADSGSTVEGSGAVVAGNTVTIESAGSYTLSGTLSDGQVIVDTADEAPVRLILNGISLHSSTTAPIQVLNAEATVIELAEGSDNFLSDTANYQFPDAETDEPNATLFSKDDLTITGTGSITISGNYNDALASKDGLVITSGNLILTAVDDGLRGKDYVVIQGGTLNITAGGDGIKSDEDEDPSKGYILIEQGNITINAGGDGLAAETDVIISDGTFAITSGGGSTAIIGTDVSAKGIKGAVSVAIDGGTFTINAADDGLHSNDQMVVNGGTFVIATGDDGLHADETVTINGGNINITESYEGIESAVITINAGEIEIVSSDDGLNVAGGADGSGFQPGPGRGGRGPGGGGPGGGGGQDNFTYTGDYYLYINGGTILIDAGGDGLDANGAIEMTGGVVLVNGPTEQMNGALDYDGTFTLTGGYLVAVGSAGMAQGPGTSSSQNSLVITFNDTQPAGSLIHITTSDGTNLLTFAPTKAYQSVVFTSAELTLGETYDVYLGGSADGNSVGGLYTNGSYTSGTLYNSVTLDSMVTWVGGGRNFR